MEKEIGLIEVHRICAEHQIEIRDLRPITGSFGKRIFLINQVLLLRVSESSMTSEQERFRRVATLDFVPKIIHTGALEREAGPITYTLLTLLPGDDFANVYQETTEAQQRQLGRDIAVFLDTLHEFSGTAYDIGLYVPALPRFSGTWREGHQTYWELLKQKSEQVPLKRESTLVLARAFQFLQRSDAVLDFQTGPKLLHNDLHPKNILLHQGKFSGVIDWECSQFGEADFDLCHFVHWCLYPPQSTIDFRMFLRGLFEGFPRCAQVPNLSQRLTLYQIEHEIQQIIWQGSEAESWRVPRLVRWMDGSASELIADVGVDGRGG